MTAFADRIAAAPSLRETFAGILNNWRMAAARRAAYRETRDQLMALTDRELDDLGLSRWDVERAARASVYGR